MCNTFANKPETQEADRHTTPNATDGRADRRPDGRTDGQTDRQTHTPEEDAPTRQTNEHGQAGTKARANQVCLIPGEALREDQYFVNLIIPGC